MGSQGQAGDRLAGERGPACQAKQWVSWRTRPLWTAPVSCISMPSKIVAWCRFLGCGPRMRCRDSPNPPFFCPRDTHWIRTVVFSQSYCTCSRGKPGTVAFVWADKEKRERGEKESKTGLSLCEKGAAYKQKKWCCVWSSVEQPAEHSVSAKLASRADLTPLLYLLPNLLLIDLAYSFNTSPLRLVF